jgi:polar amino acid transport system substrate-binding protein
MTILRRSGLFLVAILVLVACQPAGSGSSATGGAAGNPDDMLAKIKAAGKIRVATDPAYPPQSELKPDGTYEGFDIDVANKIGEKLGVKVEFITPDFAEVEAGGWADRWDISVGSMTITEPRSKVLDFTVPYYYTPAQMGATTASGITTLDGLAGKTVCVGESTTYQFWLEGTLKLLGGVPEPAPVPEGAKVTTFSTDSECADAIAAGRNDFEGWLTSSTTLDSAIANGAKFVKVGDPVFYEALAVATDKSAATHTELQAELDKIIKGLHDDGTLTTLSKKWYEGADLTKTQ